MRMEAITAELASLREQVKRLENSLAGLEDVLATVDRELLVGIVDEERKKYLQSRQIALQNEIVATKNEIAATRYEIAAKTNEIAATRNEIAAKTNKEVFLLQQQGNLAKTSATLKPPRPVFHRSDFVRGVMDCNHPNYLFSASCLSLVGADVCVDEAVAKVLKYLPIHTGTLPALVA